MKSDRRLRNCIFFSMCAALITIAAYTASRHLRRSNPVAAEVDYLDSYTHRSDSGWISVRGRATVRVKNRSDRTVKLQTPIVLKARDSGDQWVLYGQTIPADAATAVREVSANGLMSAEFDYEFAFYGAFDDVYEVVVDGQPHEVRGLVKFQHRSD